MADRDMYPDWILPAKPIEKIGDVNYEDDDED
jgi:hypothetical protein